MTAKYEITVKFTIVQDLNRIEDVLDFHKVAEQACQSLADQLTDQDAVTFYELVSGKMDAK